MDEKIFNEIEAYLHGNMTQEGALDFERRMAIDNELKKKVVLFKELSNHFNADTTERTDIDNEYTADLKKFFESEEAKEIKQQLTDSKEKYSKKKPNNRRFIIGIAASLLLLITVFVFQNNEKVSSADLYTTYYSITDLPSVASRDENTSIVQKAVHAFKKKEYEVAIENFEMLTEVEDSMMIPVYLYKGASYMELGKQEEALKAFDIVATSNSIDASKGIWFKVLSYLKEDDVVNAKHTLLLIKKGDFNYTKAQQLLETL